MLTQDAGWPSLRVNERLPHTKLPNRRAMLIERAVVSAMVVVPMIGATYGVALLLSGSLGFRDHLLFVLFYLVTGFGITIGYHRHFSHRAFETSEPLRVALAIAGAMAFQGPVIRWVADHRRHHAFADNPGDPHSPLVSPLGGRLGTLRGLWHAHVGWFFDRQKTRVRLYAGELVRDPWVSWTDRRYGLWVLLSVGAPGVMAFAIHGSVLELCHAVVWAGLTRIFAVQQVTWAVNSICHRRDDSGQGKADASRNNWLIALLALGEGWHKNHHERPSAALHGLRRREIDSSGWVIQVLERAGLIWKVRRSPPVEARDQW